MFSPARSGGVFRRRLSAILGATALASFALAAPLSQPASAATNTVVSFTFDDGQASQYSTLSTLSSHGMAGTYYINSALVGGSSYYMTWSQIQELANAGAEIGGHTLHHTDLTSLSQSAAQTEVCQDRDNLIARGFANPTSFAYPYAAVNSTAEQVVAGCGYTSARGVGGVNSGSVCRDCPYAESVPPGNAFNLQTPEAADSSTSLAQLQSYVTNAENNGGGWVVLTFHGICSNSCTGGNSFDPTAFNAFLDWLQPRAANGTTVRTVGQVMNPGPPGPDVTAPTTATSCDGGSCAGWFRTQPVSVGLTASDVGGSGVDRTLYTTDGSDPTTSPTATVYTAPFAVSQGQSVRYASVDVAGNVEASKTLTVRFDLVAPSVSITQPTEGATIRRNRATTITATAADQAGGSGVTTVGFYLDGTLLGNDASAPYQRAWTPRNAALGAHTLTAVATDAAGNTTTSAQVHVTVVR